MESDSTQITGSPAGLKAPRSGHVLGERFEITQLVESDALALTYRGLDQETDEAVLVRMTAPGRLTEREATRMHERLLTLAGARGEVASSSLWPRVLDADREGALVSLVEPWPKGISFRAVLEARRSKNLRFGAAELLPFVGRIAAALDAMPDRGPLASFHHGDLRAERIFVHADGLSLTGGFLLSALPGDVVSEALAEDIALRRSLPPEFADGLAGRPADRHAVAALAWEALEGTPPPPSPRPSDARAEPALAAVLARYLDPDPAARPATLRGLVEALAARASLPVPEHEDRLVLIPGKASTTPEPTTATGSYALSDSALIPLEGGTGPVPSEQSTEPILLEGASSSPRMSETGTFQLDGDELLSLSAKDPRTAPDLHEGAPTERPERQADDARASRLQGALAQPRLPGSQASPHTGPTAPRTGPAAPRPREQPPSEPRPIPTRARAPEPKRPHRTTKPLGELAAPASSPTPAALRGADRTEELAAQDLALLEPSDAAPRVAEARAPWQHQPLPRSAAPLPGLQSPPAGSAPVPSTPSAAAGGASGLSLIVAAVALAFVILGAAFWYRARAAQLRHEEEIEQRLQDLRR